MCQSENVCSGCAGDTAGPDSHVRLSNPFPHNPSSSLPPSPPSPLFLQVEHQNTLMHINEETDSFSDLLQVVFAKSDTQAVERFKGFASMLKKQKQMEVESEVSKITQRYDVEMAQLKTKVWRCLIDPHTLMST